MDDGVMGHSPVCLQEDELRRDAELMNRRSHYMHLFGAFVFWLLTLTIALDPPAWARGRDVGGNGMEGASMWLRDVAWFILALGSVGQVRRPPIMAHRGARLIYRHSRPLASTS